jgi:hypothetical protein
MSELFTVAFAGFAEEDSFDLAAGFESFCDEAETFDAYAARIGWEAASEGDAKLLEPAIVAAGEEGVGRGFGGWGHWRAG